MTHFNDVIKILFRFAFVTSNIPLFIFLYLDSCKSVSSNLHYPYLIQYVYQLYILRDRCQSSKTIEILEKLSQYQPYFDSILFRTQGIRRSISSLSTNKLHCGVEQNLYLCDCAVLKLGQMLQLETLWHWKLNFPRKLEDRHRMTYFSWLSWIHMIRRSIQYIPSPTTS